MRKTQTSNEKPETNEAVAQENQERKQSILTHLLALRKTLVISFGAIAAAFLLVFYLACGYLMNFITTPIVERGVEIIYTAVSEALVTQLKVSLIAAVVVASPVVFWQIWAFIKPALYPNEKRIFKRLFFSKAAFFHAFGYKFIKVVQHFPKISLVAFVKRFQNFHVFICQQACCALFMCFGVS